MAIRVSVPLEWLSAVALAIPVVVVSIAVATTPGPRRAIGWAATRGAEITEAGAEAVSRHLLRVRAARGVGVSGVIALEMMLVARYNAEPSSFNWYVDGWAREAGPNVLIPWGYLIGSVTAEAMKPRSQAGVVSLRRRRVVEFVDPWLQRWMVGGLVAVVVANLVRFIPSGSADVVRPSLTQVVLTASAATGALMAAVAVALRPERSADAESFVVEELTRTSTVNSLWACSVFGLTSVAFQLAAFSVSGWTEWLMLPIGLVHLAAFGMWVDAGSTFRFRTHRIDTFRRVAAGAVS